MSFYLKHYILQLEDEDFDCSAVQNMYQDDPELFEGSDMMNLLSMCLNGEISTSEEVSEAFNNLESSTPTVDTQIDKIATGICEHLDSPSVSAQLSSQSSTISSSMSFKNSTLAIQEACSQHPRNNEHVVDVAAQHQFEHSPTDEGDYFHWYLVCHRNILTHLFFLLYRFC